MTTEIEINPGKFKETISKPGTVKSPSFIRGSIRHKLESIDEAVVKEILYRIDNSILEFINLDRNLREGCKIGMTISYKPTTRKPNEVELEKITKILLNSGWTYYSLQSIALPGEVKFSITEI